MRRDGLERYQHVRAELLTVVVRVLGRAAALGLAWLSLAGCYTYAPLIAPAPDPKQVLAFDLNDVGRAAVADPVGPETARVEGTLLRLTDADYEVSVSQVITLRGRTYHWTGETVTLSRSYVREVRERRFSAPRTVAVAGSATLSFLAFVVSRGLGVLGGGESNRLPPSDDDPTR